MVIIHLLTGMILQVLNIQDFLFDNTGFRNRRNAGIPRPVILSLRSWMYHDFFRLAKKRVKPWIEKGLNLVAWLMKDI